MNTDDLKILLSSLELAQLFAIQAQTEQAIKEKVSAMELEPMEVANIKHKAINRKTVMV